MLQIKLNYNLLNPDVNLSSSLGVTIFSMYMYICTSSMFASASSESLSLAPYTAL